MNWRRIILYLPYHLAFFTMYGFIWLMSSKQQADEFFEEWESL